jgi:DNA-binding winged helix-turn-helix (wHTH) protein
VENIQRLPAPIRFGVFEVDLHAGELRRQGVRVRLQDQPFRVLTMLLERSGEVVTREELQKKLWPADTFVDFERGLNRAINKLREALADDADRPRFIETLPRRGYRFLVSVETVGAREVEGSGRKNLAILPSDRPHATEAHSAIAFSTRQILPGRSPASWPWSL